MTPWRDCPQYNEATDRRHVRRELTPEELAYLLAHVEHSDGENYPAIRPGPGDGVSCGPRDGLSSQRTADVDAGIVRPAGGPAHGDSGGGLLQATPAGRATHPARSGRAVAALAGRIALGTNGCSGCPTTRPRCFNATWRRPGRHGSRKPRRTPNGNGGTKRDFLRYRDADGRVADFHASGTRTSRASWPAGASVKTAQDWPGIQRPS